MEAKKIKITNENVRYSYYETSDKITALVDKSYQIGDEELIKIAKELKKNLDKYHQLLEDKYIWD
jgi:hypothetical protein